MNDRDQRPGGCGSESNSGFAHVHASEIGGRTCENTYRVYVIELSRDCTPRACPSPLCTWANPHTILNIASPKTRLVGTLAASKAHKYGVRLRYDLMDNIALCTTRSEADQRESAVAEGLERRGHRVFGDRETRADRGSRS
jgi:hypothetical protein